MTRVFIKFANPDDVYKVDPLWNHLGEFPRRPNCERCGSPRYIPVDISDVTIVEPLPYRYRPFPVDDPYLVILSEPDLPSLELPNGEYIPILGYRDKFLDCETCFPVIEKSESDCAE